MSTYCPVKPVFQRDITQNMDIKGSALYACLLPGRSAISEKLVKNTYACGGRTAPQA